MSPHIAFYDVYLWDHFNQLILNHSPSTWLLHLASSHLILWSHVEPIDVASVSPSLRAVHLRLGAVHLRRGERRSRRAAGGRGWEPSELWGLRLQGGAAGRLDVWMGLEGWFARCWGGGWKVCGVFGKQKGSKDDCWFEQVVKDRTFVERNQKYCEDLSLNNALWVEPGQSMQSKEENSTGNYQLEYLCANICQSHNCLQL